MTPVFLIPKNINYIFKLFSFTGKNLRSHFEFSIVPSPLLIDYFVVFSFSHLSPNFDYTKPVQIGSQSGQEIHLLDSSSGHNTMCRDMVLLGSGSSRDLVVHEIPVIPCHNTYIKILRRMSWVRIVIQVKYT